MEEGVKGDTRKMKDRKEEVGLEKRERRKMW